jgi:hypothetical protein
MAKHRRPSPVKPAAALTLLAAPLLVLGALLSKMDTIERYYTQLWIVGVVAVLCVVAAVGALAQSHLATWLLTVLYGLAAAFWLYSAITLALVSVPGESSFGLAVFPALIGIVCGSFAAALFVHCNSGRAQAKAEHRDDA